MINKTTKGITLLSALFLLITLPARSSNLCHASDSSQTGSIEGKLIDSSTKKPIEYALITAFKENVPKGSVYSEEDGTFKISSLAPGTYELSIVEINHKKATVTEVPLKPGYTTEMLVINMPDAKSPEELRIKYRAPLPHEINRGCYDVDSPGITQAPKHKMNAAIDSFKSAQPVKAYSGIKGQVLDAKTNRPIAFAGIFVSQNGYSIASTWSDSNGNYLINGLAPGFYLVDYQIKDYIRSTFSVKIESKELTVVYADLEHDTDARFKADYRTAADSGILKGRVYCNAHIRTKNLEAATVTARDSNGIVRAAAYTDEKGWYSMSLIPGTYTVEVQDIHHKKVLKEVKVFPAQSSIVRFEMKEHQKLRD